MQLYHYLNAAAHFLNPEYFFSNPKIAKDKAVNGLYVWNERLSKNAGEDDQISNELSTYIRSES